MAGAALPAEPRNSSGPSLQARAGGGFSATLCNQAGGAGAGMGLPGSGAGSRRGGRRGSELATSLRDVWALRLLLLHRRRLGRVVRGTAPEAREVCGGRVWPGQAQPGWSGGVGGPGRRHAPGLEGGGWKYHPPHPPSRPFFSLGVLKKPPLPASPGIPELFFSSLHYSPTCGSPKPRARPPRAPLFTFPGAPGHLSVPEYPPPSRSRIPENTPPSPYSLSSHRPTPCCPAP